MEQEDMQRKDVVEEVVAVEELFFEQQRVKQ
jgi:hypothetical protein